MGFFSLPSHATLRAYPEGLGHYFLQTWREVQDLPRQCMRQKVVINTTATDRELFEKLPLGDVWSEAEVIQVWAYLYRNSHLKIPDSWQETLSNFNRELMDIVGPPESLWLLIRVLC